MSSPNTLHPDYSRTFAMWNRARDVLAGEGAVKARGERYLPRLDGATDDEYLAYKERASFFNATARTADGYLGLIFRRAPQIELPHPQTVRSAAAFARDCDLQGSSLTQYARRVTEEVIATGRGGTLVDWAESLGRAYLCFYRAEQILNWRVERVGDRRELVLLVLNEPQSVPGDDLFSTRIAEQVRVLYLHAGACVAETWRPNGSGDWAMVESRTPRKAGRALDSIPFIFHGARDSSPDVGPLPLQDMIPVNLSHYRLTADYRQGMHCTALPTAWLAGYDPTKTWRIGTSTAWVTENAEARAGYLEYSGQGLGSFERALDRDERTMAMLGSRLLEPRKNVGETAEAIELRQSGESSVLGALALAVSHSLTRAMERACWWGSACERLLDFPADAASLMLNTDFTTKSMDPQTLRELVATWQAGAMTRGELEASLRRGEVLPNNAPHTPGAPLGE